MIPTISCQEVDHKALKAACRDWGFFVLKDHDIDPSLIEAGLSATAQFFQQPPEEKNKIRRNAANSWGYNDAELTKNKRDWKEILDIGHAVNEGPLKALHRNGRASRNSGQPCRSFPTRCTRLP